MILLYRCDVAAFFPTLVNLNLRACVVLFLTTFCLGTLSQVDN
jgi:hypothetical protein